MKYKLPLLIPEGYVPHIVALFGDTSSVAWYRENGLNLDYHNGVDIALITPELTYGTAIVCPVPAAELSKTWWENSMSTSGNGIQIAWEENNDRYNMRAWHCSEIVTKSSYKEGNVIGYIGNSGLVRPAPTPQSPFGGSHIHLMLYKNGVLVDPLTVFNRDDWFISTTDTGIEKDLPPLRWALQFVLKQLRKLLELIVK